MRKILLSFFVVFLGSPALACVAGIEKFEDSFRLSTHIFAGKVVSETCEYDFSERRDVMLTKFSVYDVWKGNVSREFLMKEYAHMSCFKGPVYFHSGGVYLVYAHPSMTASGEKSNTVLSAIGMCGRTQSIKNYDNKTTLKNENEDFKHLGNPSISYGVEE